jgi:single-stranded-DNA-specific exonuclease
MIQETRSREWKSRTAQGDSSQDLSEKISFLQKETGLSPITLRVCILRGLDSAQLIQEYLSPRFENLRNPWTIKDMQQAVDRVASLRGTNQKIRVFGDYDVDGTTGAALLSWVFREFGFSCDVRQPDRFKDGYGLNIKAVEEAVRDQINLLVTVDCGITSFDAISRAHELGLDVIVIDHHQLDAGKGLPPALAVVNPQRPDCESGLKQLCGCGLAFYFARALRARGKEENWFSDGNAPNLKQHLDLVVMATAADMVPLVGDNHILVRYGLEVLKNSKKPGVKALLEAAGLASRDVSPSHLGFVIGPRINASGRMHSASLALELLTTTDSSRAYELAHELERLNEERASLQNQIWDEVRIRIEKGLSLGKYRYGIAVGDSNWHEGVVGIVASRVTETFHKPAVVVALREDFGKGSVRSFGGKDVLMALRECSSHLLGFGGHRYAAGLSISLAQFESFADAFDLAVGNLQSDAAAQSLWIEGECSIDDLNVRSLQELERLGPFGPGNPEPVFSVRAAMRNQRILKGRHLKLNLEPLGTGQRKSTIEAIWFHGAERQDVLNESLLSEEWEWAGVPELNRFRGQMTPTFRVKDWRKVRI